MFSELAVTGLFYVRFGDIGDSDKAYSTIKAYRREWDVRYIFPQQFALKSRPEKFRSSPVSNYEGQVLVKAEYTGYPKNFDAVAIGHLVREAIEEVGCIVAFESCMVKAMVATYRAEYSSVNTTENALSRLNGLGLAVRFSSRTGYGYLQMADSHRCAP